MYSPEFRAYGLGPRIKGSGSRAWGASAGLYLVVNELRLQYTMCKKP